MKLSTNETILNNLLIERELAIAKIQFTTARLEQLETQISELREIVENEKQQPENMNG